MGVKELPPMATGATKHDKKVQADRNGASRDKVEKITEVAVKTFKKAIKELEKH